MILLNPGLNAFKAIAETGSVHAAARSLGLTQTAVTQRLKGLESHLRLTLFLRSRRGMSLTSDGSALLQYCRANADLEGEFFSRVSGHSPIDVALTVAGPTSALSTRIVENCAGLYFKFPHLRLHLRSDDHANRTDLVRRGEVDMAIVATDEVPNEMDSKVLKADRYLLVGSAKWKGRRLQEILETERVIDFYEGDLTTRHYLKKFGFTTKRERLYVNQNQALIHLFTNGVGYGTLTESVARPHLEDGSLIVLNKGHAMEDPLALIWYPRPQKPDYFAELIRAIK